MILCARDDVLLFQHFAVSRSDSLAALDSRLASRSLTCRPMWRNNNNLLIWRRRCGTDTSRAPQRAMRNRHYGTANCFIFVLLKTPNLFIKFIQIIISIVTVVFNNDPYCFKSQDSSVDTATSYGLDDRGVGVQVPVGVRIFTSPDRPHRLWGPPNLLSNGYRGRLGHEADHSPPASAEVKKIWIYTSTPHTPSWRNA
jgi:hypothetical protein